MSFELIAPGDGDAVPLGNKFLKKSSNKWSSLADESEKWSDGDFGFKIEGIMRRFINNYDPKNDSHMSALSDLAAILATSENKRFINKINYYLNMLVFKNPSDEFVLSTYFSLPQHDLFDPHDLLEHAIDKQHYDLFRGIIPIVRHDFVEAGFLFSSLYSVVRHRTMGSGQDSILQNMQTELSEVFTEIVSTPAGKRELEAEVEAAYEFLDRAIVDKVQRAILSHTDCIGKEKIGGINTRGLKLFDTLAEELKRNFISYTGRFISDFHMFIEFVATDHSKYDLKLDKLLRQFWFFTWLKWYTVAQERIDDIRALLVSPRPIPQERIFDVAEELELLPKNEYSTIYRGFSEIFYGLKHQKSLSGKNYVEITSDQAISWTKCFRVTTGFGSAAYKTTVRPKDVLVDTTKIENFMTDFYTYDDQQEVILKPGTYTCTPCGKTAESCSANPSNEKHALKREHSSRKKAFNYHDAQSCFYDLFIKTCDLYNDSPEEGSEQWRALRALDFTKTSMTWYKTLS